MAFLWFWHLTLAAAAAVGATVVTNDTAAATGKTFDYVIVGAGLSGITVANKLSSKGHSVLIIEAGPDARWNPVIYNAEDRQYGDVYCNWKYPAYAEDGSALSWKIDAGACIGGGTSINGMMWYRPTKPEMDKLGELGNSGWNWNSLKPYMTAIERNIPPTAAQQAQGAGIDPAVHGFSGAVNVSFATPMRVPGLVSLFKQAMPSVFPGLSVGIDLSSRLSTVLASSSWTIWWDPATNKTRRSSAADALLWAPDQQRPRLTILANHKVDKVLLNKKKKATGVEFVFNGNTTAPATYKVYASKEVIVSGGALASAAVLERSGIGRESILRAAGVKPLVDLPGVGSNLNDQPGTGTSATVVESQVNNASIYDGRGLFAPGLSLVNIPQIWGASASAVSNDLLSTTALRSRAQALVNAGAAVNVAGAEAILNATIDLVTRSQQPVGEVIIDSYPYVLAGIFWPLMPLSRGHMHIRSADPLQHPIITPRLLTDTFDQAVAVALARRTRALFTSAPFAGTVANAYADPPIGANGTDAEYLAWLKSSSYGASHWLGTAAMLPKRLGGVVDSRLRVYGTKNLRVVDASILPFQISAHMMSTLYAIASRAGDLILDDA